MVIRKKSCGHQHWNVDFFRHKVTASHFPYQWCWRQHHVKQKNITFFTGFDTKLFHSLLSQRLSKTKIVWGGFIYMTLQWITKPHQFVLLQSSTDGPIHSATKFRFHRKACRLSVQQRNKHCHFAKHKTDECQLWINWAVMLLSPKHNLHICLWCSLASSLLS